MGFVRTGRNTISTRGVITNVFRQIATRGRDAAGWGMLLPRGAMMEKAPFPSTRLVKWKNYKRNIPSINLMVGHARFATMGDEKRNRNNHPHCSRGLQNMIVHNGVVYDAWEEYPVRSECDSEIILRAIEQRGIKKACKEMATWYASSYAWLDLRPQEEKIYAYRNDDMPAGYIDLTMEIGGIIIASTKGIIESALKESRIEISGLYTRFVEFDAYHLYVFRLGQRKPLVRKMAEPPSYNRRYGSYYQNYNSGRDPYDDYESYVVVKGMYIPVKYATKEELEVGEWKYVHNRAARKNTSTSMKNVTPVDAKPLSDELAEAKAKREQARRQLLSDPDEELAQLNAYYSLKEAGYFQGVEEI